MMLLTSLHMAINNCPEYITGEAETLLAKLSELVPQEGELSLKMSYAGMFYRADFRLNCETWHMSAYSKSRYLEDALEDSFVKLLGLLQPFSTRIVQNTPVKGNFDENGYIERAPAGQAP